MAGMRPFRFMIGSRDVVDARTLAERARWAEGIGGSHVCVHDHLAPQHAPIPLLTAVAMATERLRLCPLVFNNDLRHPAVLAQELASLDILSGGRLDVGIGAGWNEPEYRAAGLAFDPAGDQDRATDGGHRDPPRAVRRRPVQLRGPVLHDHRRWTGSRSRSSGRTRRSSSAGRGSASSGWRPARPTSSGSTCASDGEAILDAFEARTDVRVGWIRDEAGDRFGQLDLSVLRLLGDITITRQPLKAAADVARRSPTGRASRSPRRMSSSRPTR